MPNRAMIYDNIWCSWLFAVWIDTDMIYMFWLTYIKHHLTEIIQ